MPLLIKHTHTSRRSSDQRRNVRQLRVRDCPSPTEPIMSALSFFHTHVPPSHDLKKIPYLRSFVHASPHVQTHT